ncbi:MAG: serine protease [Marinilabiliales bacterium]|nr:MAG: serine protease [Marinilabiliales bacterium]
MIKYSLTYFTRFILMVSFVVFSLQMNGNETDSSQQKKVYIFDIKEMIAPPVWRTTKLAMEAAVDQKADIILIHMNTYGGTLDDADSIRTKILNSRIPVYVFIDKNAASAGALISIACDSIYMAPGANIGAATVVNQQGEQMPDKYQSYMRSMMRSTAEAKNRDVDIAQAMVDPKVYVAGISDSGQVLTFTVSEAIKYDFCEAKLNSIEEVLERTGYEDSEIIRHQLSATDKIIGWLIHPIVSGILIMIIVGGIYFELQTPGIGFPIAAATLAALLYFAPLYIEGLANNWEILIFVAGLILIAVEIFAIPGFGVAGILGIILMVSGLTLSMVDQIGPGTFDYDLSKLVRAFFVVIIAFFVSIVGSIALSKQLFSTTRFGNLALVKTQITDEGYSSATVAYKSMINKSGVSRTILRPSGKIEIDGDLYDAVALTSYINKGEKVIFVDYHNAQLVVKKV